MSDNLSLLIDYHAVRAVEELERAEGTKADAERSAHMELSRLHLCKAGWLREKMPPSPPSVLPQVADLDMGEASREQGFRLFGCR